MLKIKGKKMIFVTNEMLVIISEEAMDKIPFLKENLRYEETLENVYEFLDSNKDVIEIDYRTSGGYGYLNQSNKKLGTTSISFEAEEFLEAAEEFELDFHKIIEDIKDFNLKQTINNETEEVLKAKNNSELKM